jgi:hypothetical protein
MVREDDGMPDSTGSCTNMKQPWLVAMECIYPWYASGQCFVLAKGSDEMLGTVLRVVVDWVDDHFSGH